MLLKREKIQLSRDLVADSGDSGFLNFLPGGRFLARFDWLQILPAIALLAIGAIFIYGTGQQVGGIHATVIWKRQLFYIGIGTVLWLFFSLLDYRWLMPFSCVLYPLSIVLLLLTLLCGTTIYGARRWLTIGGFTFQSAEIAKIAVMLLVSALLSYRKVDINKFWVMFAVLFVTAIPCLLIYKEPDLGTTLVFLPIVFTIAFVAKLKIRYIIIGAILLGVACTLTYAHLKTYQKKRIEIFLNPESDPLNKGWNTIQAELAVGRGGATGKGYMQGTHCALGYLPTTVANSDFIFPVIAEETGFIGALSLLFLYALLVFSMARTAMVAPDPFGRYLCTGSSVVMATHIFVNIGMCIRIMPITGLPLPLVSYGGSFLFCSMIYLGITQSVYLHRNDTQFLNL